MPIWITGDCHGDFNRFKKKIDNCFPKCKEENYVIVTGDFGLVFSKRQTLAEIKDILFLNNLPFKILFVDGNHENHERLNTKYKCKMWHGGKVHFISNNIIHLMRGQVYEILGNKVFTFGGAMSHDIPYGVLYKNDHRYLDKKREMEENGLFYRTAYEDWWPNEISSESERREGLTNLNAVGNKVDFIITHCAPQSIQNEIYRGKVITDEQAEYLESIKRDISYKKWFFGHYHSNRVWDDTFYLIHEEIKQIVF